MALLPLLMGSTATGGSRGSCRRVDLSIRPYWASSGAWTAEGDLLIADATSKSILRYSEDGRALGTIPEKIGADLADFFPQMIRSTPQGNLFVELFHGRLAVFDKHYVLQSKSDINAKSKALGLSVQGMYLWEPIGHDLVTFSDIQGPNDKDWHSGFVRFPADRPQDFSVLYTMQFKDPTHVFYQLGHPYITSLGNTAYALLMESKMVILKGMNGGLVPMAASAFPADQLTLAPQLPELEATDDLPQVMRAVEASTMPTGLYGWENSLYLLWRRPEGNATKWFLTKIDAAREKVIGTVSIKSTSANHLTVVPGPRFWAFIEKGPAKGWGLQDVKSIFYVPSDDLRRTFKDGTDLCR